MPGKFPFERVAVAKKCSVACQENFHNEPTSSSESITSRYFIKFEIWNTKNCSGRFGIRK